MLARIEKDESLRADIALLCLDKLMQFIDETTQQIALHVSYRVNKKKLRQKKGRDIRDAAYEEVKTMANYIESKLSLMQRSVEAEHYKLLLEIDSELKDIRKIFRIRTAKDKTRKRKDELKRLSANKQTEMKQSEAVKQNTQTEALSIELTKIVERPSTNEILTKNAVEVSNESNSKKEKAKVKFKMNRRKIRQVRL